MSFWKCDHVMSVTKLYILTYIKPIRMKLSKVTRLGDLTHKFISPLITLTNATWQIRNVTSPLHQELLPKKLGGWWLRVVDSHQLSQINFSSRGHVRTHDKLKILYPSSTKKWPPNFQGSRFWLRGSQLLSQITTWLQDLVLNEKIR